MAKIPAPAKTKIKPTVVTNTKASTAGQQGKSSGGTTGGSTAQTTGDLNAQNKKEAEMPPLEKFFCDQLMDIYYTEQKLTKILPMFESSATSEELKEAFSDHLHQTQKHIKRLDKVFSLIGKKAEGKKCEVIEGLAKEGETIISETPTGTMTRDAALIIAAQKTEHYEIATYGGLVQLALTMGLDEVADLLDTTLMEEEDTDSLLTEIAENHINMEAEQEGANYSWSQEQEEAAQETEE